jgi:UDP-glucose 4-epimerase
VRRIAITGIASFLGSRLLRRLVDRHGADGMVTVDVAPPPPLLSVHHHELDLTEPASDQRLLDVLRAEDVGTVLHCALLTNPHRDASYAHELESIGTLAVMAAAAAGGVDQVVVRSFTAVYGARGQNPNFLGEDHQLYASPSLRWARDKVEAEQHAASFARRYPDMAVCVLRFAPLFGPAVHTFYTGIFDHRVVPVVMGYDPLVQLLHPEDALAAAELAIDRRARGPINVVPTRPIPLLTALHLAAKIPVSVPHLLAYGAADALWATGMAAAPGGFVDYARYLFVADGERARRELGFSARWSSRDALFAYLRYRYPDRSPRPVEAHA